MFWITLIIVQLVMWYLTFFKSKKMVRDASKRDRWGNVPFSPTNERFKFVLWQVALVFVSCLIPIVGLGVIIAITVVATDASDSEFGDERPSLFFAEIFLKKI